MRVGSLFSGFGGLDAAACQHYGAEVAWHVEFDKHPSAVLAHHFPGVPNYGDVTKVDWTRVEPVDIITGGFPCQDVSHAGLRRGVHRGTRSGLWFEMARAIDALKPTKVVIENVAGLLSASAAGDVEPCPWCLGDGAEGAVRALGAVVADLAEMGYVGRWGSVRASDAGAAHRRERVFIVAADAGRVRLEWSGGSRYGRRGPAVDRGVADLTLLPTPKASDGPNGGPGMRNGRGVADALPGVAALLPTPTSRDHKGRNQRNDTTCLPGALLPTPRATRGGSATETQALLSTPTAGLGTGGGQRSHRWRDDSQRTHNPTELARDMADGVMTDFGPYSAAVARWEQVLGRPAPSPTEPGKDGRPRLSATFVEWLMGLPEGWVTGVPGVSRTAQLKMLGNGVVPQQALLALSLLDPPQGESS